MAPTEPIRIVRTEHNENAPTGEGPIYIDQAGTRWYSDPGSIALRSKSGRRAIYQTDGTLWLY